jgi:hypothetical protein
MVKKANRSGDYRSFKIEGSSIGYEGSTFVSANPGDSARKAARKLHSLVEKDPEYSRFRSDKLIQVILRETTQGSKHGIYAYDTYKVKLADPVERKLPNGDTYLVEHTYKAKALKEQDVGANLKRKYMSLQNA